MKKEETVLEKLPRPEKTTLLEDLEDGMCGFTYGDIGTEDFTYCARATKGTKRYCDRHHDDMFYLPQEAKERREEQPRWNFDSKYHSLDFRRH